MAIIAQKNIYSWQQIEESPDLIRLKMVLEVLPDEKLMRTLESERKGRRDDYPIRAVWNSILAGIVFQHPSIESLRRELLRNAELRELCGFGQLFNKNEKKIIFNEQQDTKSKKKKTSVPPKDVYSRFLQKLMTHQDKIDAMFNELVEMLRKLLPDFGKRLAIDSKALKTHHYRTDNDADKGVKKYVCEKKDGTTYEKIKSWFGYKLHLIVDADYELPVAYMITKASKSDSPTLLPMTEKLSEKHPKLIKRTEYMSSDKGYDSEKNCRELYDKYGIKPIGDIRNMWRDDPNELRPLYPDKCDNIYYDARGSVYCYCGLGTDREDFAQMAFDGFEKDRLSLKYRCPAKAYGLTCHRVNECNEGKHTEYGRIVRIKLDENRRLFTPVARGTYKWKREYNKRNSVERVNGRIDESFGFEKHFIWGLDKMNQRMGLAMIVMLAMAVAQARRNKMNLLRSLVKVA